MTEYAPLIAFLAFILALLIGTAIGLHYQRTNTASRREELKRQYEAARQSHRASREIRKLFVQATCKELRQ